MVHATRSDLAIAPVEDAADAVPVPTEAAAAALSEISGSTSARFSNVLMNDLAAAVRIAAAPAEAQMARLGAAMDAVASFHPQSEVESMLAAQFVALNQACMLAMRRAAATGQTEDGAERWMRQAAKLSQASVAVVDAIERRRGRGPQQTVRVEHVTVEAGGQAIVGAIAPEACRPRGRG